jgi:hypothetical protein
LNLACEQVAAKALGPALRRSGAELFWRCPNHDDRRPSLQINENKNAFLCGPCNQSGNAWRLAAFIARVEPQDTKAVAGWLRERGLLDGGNGNGNGHHKAPSPSSEPKAEFVKVAEFYYGPDLRKIRLERPQETDSDKPEKSFRWEHRKSDSWLPGAGGLPKPLYSNRLFRELEHFAIAYGFEGEAKADLAAELNLPAFSFKDLAEAHCDALAGLDVVLWPDADRPGFKQCNAAAKIIYDSGQSRMVRIITPPVGLPIGGDIVDCVKTLRWSRTQIDKLIAEAKTFPPEPEPVGLLLDSVREQKVDWLWRSRIPRGALTVLDGDPGGGKSVLSIDIAAHVSTGTPLPGETAKRDPSGVVICSAEDSLSHVIVPRLRAAGADLSRIVAIPYSPSVPGEQTFSKLPGDLPILQRAIERVNASLVILDVLVCYIPATLSTNRDQDVRLALAPLAQLADRMQFSCLLLRHLNKNTANPTLYRGGGSIGIVGAARSGLLLANNPNDPQTRVLALIKSNFGAPAVSLSFNIQTADGLPIIQWTGTCDQTAEQLLAPQTAEEHGAIREAVEFLREELRNGPIPAKELFKTAENLGISKASLKRAKPSLATSYKVGLDAWFWELNVEPGR